MTKPQGRGGKRPGAGRPALPAKQRRVPLQVRVLPATLEAVEHRAQTDGTTKGVAVDAIVAGEKKRARKP